MGPQVHGIRHCKVSEPYITFTESLLHKSGFTVGTYQVIGAVRKHPLYTRKAAQTVEAPPPPAPSLCILLPVLSPTSAAFRTTHAAGPYVPQCGAAFY